MIDTQVIAGKIYVKEAKRKFIKLGFPPSFVHANLVSCEAYLVSLPRSIKITPKGFVVRADFNDTFLEYIAYA